MKRIIPVYIFQQVNVLLVSLSFEIFLIFALKLFAFGNIKIAPPYKIVTYQLL